MKNMQRKQTIKDTPILIVSYNRSDLFDRLIKDLEQKHFSKLWVAIDGPKNKYDQEQQNNMLSTIENFKLARIKYKRLQANRGCRNGVLDAISWFFRHNTQGIIIEDDIRIDEGYMNAMCEMLSIYRDDLSIFSISSHFDPSIIKYKGEEKESRIVKSPLCRVWGWATWKNRWEIHSKSIINHQELDKISIFWKLPVSIRTKELALRIYACKSGHMKAWDYEWNLTHVKHKAYSLTPNNIYSINEGFREDATHTKGTPPWESHGKWSNQYSLTDLKNLLKEEISIIHNNCGLPKTRYVIVEYLKLIGYIFINKLKAAIKRVNYKGSL